MILKLLLMFYRWLWELPPYMATDANWFESFWIIFAGAIVDIVAIVGIVAGIIEWKNK